MQEPVADQVSGVSWPPTIVTMEFAMTSSSLNAVPVDFRRWSALIRPSVGALGAHDTRSPEVGDHFLQRRSTFRRVVRVVLEVPQHLGEIRRPGF